MRYRLYNTIGFILVLASCAYAQLQVGENTTLKLNGSAGLGWTGVYNGNDTNGLSYGGSANLSGDYYDERFLNWTISPYVNQSRINSNYNSIASASGLNAQANFLSNSRTPMQLTYSFEHNSDGTFNVPGSTGSYETVGNGQSIGLSASYLPEDLPSIQGTFSHSGSDFSVIGNPGGGQSHSTAFGLSSGYELWGTNLFGLFNMNFLNTESPRFDQPGTELKTDSNQYNLQFGAGRRFTNWSSGSVNVGRSHLTSNYAGEQIDATFNNVAALLSAQPTSRLSLSFHTNYSSNLSAQSLASILTGANSQNSSQSPQGLSSTSNYLNYGVTGGYRLATTLSATGYVNRQQQGQQGMPDTESTMMGVGVTWSHRLLGGSLGAAYGIGHSFAPIRLANQQTRDQSFTGHNVSLSYSRRVLGFSAGASGSYSRSLTTVLVGYTQTNYAASGSLSRTIDKWTISSTASYTDAKVDAQGWSDSSAQNYSLSLSHRGLGFGGHYGRSRGSGLQVGNIVVPNPLPGPLPLILFNGESYGGSVSYTPRKRWTMSGSYTKLHYGSRSPSSLSNSTSEQLYFTSQYSFRQMWFTGGFSRIKQGFGISTGPLTPATIDTVYFGVTRRFDFF